MSVRTYRNIREKLGEKLGDYKSKFGFGYILRVFQKTEICSGRTKKQSRMELLYQAALESTLVAKTQ